jgi:hypothetical protein
MAGIAAGTDSTALAANLGSTASGKGAALVGVQDAAGDWSGLNQEEVNAEIGFLLIRSGDRLNALSAFSDSEQAAIMAKTSTTDHQAQISDLLGNNRHVHFPRGRYNGSAAITITNTLHISADRGGEMRFADGAYTALTFTGSAAQNSRIDRLYLRGSSASAPALKLLGLTSQAAYVTLFDCMFAYADLALDMDGVYVTKVLANNFAACTRYWRLDDTTFGAADNLFSLNTYGTPLGTTTEPLCYCAGPGSRIVGDCWESQQKTHPVLQLATGAVYADVQARLEASGCVIVDSSVEALIQLRTKDSFDATSKYTLRVNSGGNVYVSHSSFLLGTYDATTTAISAAGGALISGTCDINKYGIGALFAASGGINDTQVRNCGTGIQFNSGSTATLGRQNTFIANTTNVVNNSGGSAIAPGNFTATLTGCTTAPTATARYEVDNGIVTLTVPGVTGTSNSTSCTLTGLPVAIQPPGAVFGSSMLLLDNGVRATEQCSVSGDTLTLYRNDSTTGFTASGTKGTRACVIQYRLRTV